ncbi:MAG: HdeD family acid-resistance protein [Bacteroidota bacterium]|jgi:uncharacterized membrane protein HdeD (DUF308 family)
MNALKQLGWPLGIIGLALLIIGLISVTAPNMSVETLMMYFGVMLLIIGGVQFTVAAMLKQKISRWLLLAALGVLFAVLGFYMVKNTQKAATAFTLIMAVWAGVMGVVQLIIAYINKPARIFLLSMGGISIFFGVLIFLNPFSGPNTLQFMVGFYTLLLSFFILYLTFKLLTAKTTQTNGNQSL